MIVLVIGVGWWAWSGPPTQLGFTSGPPFKSALTGCVSGAERGMLLARRQVQGDHGINVETSDDVVERFISEQIVDEDAAWAVANFSIPPDVLIGKAKRFLALGQGTADPNILANDFVFHGSCTGPYTKEQFVPLFWGQQLGQKFPDKNAQWYDFRVDPLEPNRVWMTCRGYGTNTGGKNPTGKSYVRPPQACSVTFDEAGLVQRYTFGYVMDRFVGNTGGLGGSFGSQYAIGKPYPCREGRPYKKSFIYAIAARLVEWKYRRQYEKAKATGEVPVASSEALPWK